MIFHNDLPKIWGFFLISFSGSAVIICCMTLDMGSLPEVQSIKVLTKFETFSMGSWNRKFLRSCPPICLRVGPFHKLDRQRTPSFLRFILQRTFFLVMKTKLGDHTALNISISLPNVQFHQKVFKE